MSTLFEPVEPHTYKPIDLKPSLAQYDNYQIYTLVCRDVTSTRTDNIYVEEFDGNHYVGIAFNGQLISGFQDNGSRWGITSDGTFILKPTPTQEEPSPSISKQDLWLAIQSFAPSPISINFLSFVNQYSDIDLNPITYSNYGIAQLKAANVWDRSGFGESSLNDEYHQNICQGYAAKVTGYELEDGTLTTDMQDLVGRDFSGNNFSSYFIKRHITRFSFFEKILNSPPPALLKPNYLDLLQGYRGDPRDIPHFPRVKPNYTGLLTISYYRENTSESIPELRSINWYRYNIEVEKDKKIYLPILGCVLGTLTINNPDIKQQINLLSTQTNRYPYKYLFEENVADLFLTWESLYTASLSLPTMPGQIIEDSVYHQLSRTIRVLGANNDIWHNGITIDDVGFDINHPMFSVDVTRTYNWHFKPQTDGSYGDLSMTDPKLDELWNHFCSETPYENDIDSDQPRLDTHGKRLKRTSEILGYRINANGEIDKKTEEDYTRHIVPPKAKIDKTKYGGNSFGSHGMHVRRLPNNFDRKEIKEGGVVAVHDLAQLMLEILDQLNLAIGIQEAGAIELKHEGQIHKYQNLLALTTDIAIHQFNQTAYAKSTHISSLVTQEQTKEIIGGLGLPTVAKSIRREVNGKVAGIPYWGIAPQASLARKIDTCTYNVGIVLGQVL
jgi:hypothetical protein